jgi:hypothetical protein
MPKRKSMCTCSFCSKIFKDPIILPCKDSICVEHLSDRDIVKQKKIKCFQCQKEHQVKKTNFKSSNTLNMLIKSQCYLNDEEISLKLELEASIGKFFDFYEKFPQKRTQLESEVFDHFDVVRTKINEQREELKKQIDALALKMINQTEKCQEIYLNDLKDKFYSSFDDSKSLANELNHIEETFRNPNLLIETIKDMQRKQNESLNGIQFILSEMNQVKSNLMATNFFKPNLSLFNQKETSLFGSIKFNKYSNMGLFKSQILTDERQMSELIRLCQFSPNDSWSLLYRATRDGFGGRDFHSKCDGHSNTLTILKTQGNSYIFGGFTTVNWDSSDKSKSDANAFIFSLTNKDNRPLKMKIEPYLHQRAIRCNHIYGPTFGDDICISNYSHTTNNSYSDLGFYYRHPQIKFRTNEAKTFLAGSEWFQLDEIEVYQKE